MVCTAPAVLDAASGIAKENGVMAVAGGVGIKLPDESNETWPRSPATPVDVPVTGVLAVPVVAYASHEPVACLTKNTFTACVPPSESLTLIELVALQLVESVGLNGVVVGTAACEFRLNAKPTFLVADGGRFEFGTTSGTVDELLITPCALAA